MNMKVLFAIYMTGCLFFCAMGTAGQQARRDKADAVRAIHAAGYEVGDVDPRSLSPNETGWKICVWTFTVEAFLALIVASWFGWMAMFGVLVVGVVISLWSPLLVVAGLPVVGLISVGFVISTAFRVFGEVGGRVIRG